MSPSEVEEARLKEDHDHDETNEVAIEGTIYGKPMVRAQKNGRIVINFQVLNKPKAGVSTIISCTARLEAANKIVSRISPSRDNMAGKRVYIRGYLYNFKPEAGEIRTSLNVTYFIWI
jgi:hypothetical protein